MFSRSDQPSGAPAPNSAGASAVPPIDILALLKTGTMSAEQLIQMISMMAGQGQQMPGAQQGAPSSPIEAAMQGGGEQGGY